MNLESGYRSRSRTADLKPKLKSFIFCGCRSRPLKYKIKLIFKIKNNLERVQYKAINTGDYTQNHYKIVEVLLYTASILYHKKEDMGIGKVHIKSKYFFPSIILAIFYFLRISMCYFVYLHLELYKFKNYKKLIL